MTDFDLLRPLTSEIKRARFAVVDIETKDGDSQRAGFTRPFLSGFFDGENYLEFSRKECLEQTLAILLTRQFEGWTFYAHNGGGFDWLHFLPHITKQGFRYEVVSVASTIMMLRVYPKGSNRKPWLFLDSFKLIPISLAKACSTFNVIKKLEDHDLNLDENDSRWSEYLERDCRALYAVLVRFHELVEVRLGGEVGVTTASTSMRTFRRAYQKDDIQRHSQFHEFFREAYYGGRVEVFKHYEEEVRYYDINSSYPKAMTEDLPVGDAIQWEGKPTKQVMFRRVGFARARVTVPTWETIPVLPFRRDGKLIYPTGTFEGVWPAIELLEAQKYGAAIEWGESVWIDAKPVLKDMVEGLYTYRDKSRPDYEEGLDATAKLLLNALYGKFAQKEEREKIVHIDDLGDIPEGSEPIDPLDDECTLYRVKEVNSACYIVPQIAAHITAIARIRLHRLLKESESRGFMPAYCDTDSVQTRANLDDLCSSELGAIKDEGKGVLYSATYLQPKLYMLEGNDGSCKVVMKGFKARDPLTGQNVRDKKTFETVRDGGSVEYTSLERLGALAKKGFLSPPVMRTVRKQLRNPDEKRLTLPDGSTIPIELG